MAAFFVFSAVVAMPLHGKLLQAGRPVPHVMVQALAAGKLHLPFSEGFGKSRLACTCGPGAVALQKILASPAPTPLATTVTGDDGSFVFPSGFAGPVVLTAASGGATAAASAGPGAEGKVDLELRVARPFVGSIGVDDDDGSPSGLPPTAGRCSSGPAPACRRPGSRAASRTRDTGSTATGPRPGASRGCA